MPESPPKSYPDLPEWPTSLAQQPPQLTPLGDRPSVYELARNYATLAAFQHAQWPSIVAALDYLRLHSSATRLETREIRNAIQVLRKDVGAAIHKLRVDLNGRAKSDDAPPSRDRLPSQHDLDEVTQRIQRVAEIVHAAAEDVADKQATTSDIQRVVRQTLTEDQLGEYKRAAEKAAEHKYGVALALLGGLLTVAGGLILWALTGHH